MSTYSNIKKIRIKNFKNLQDVEIDFTESPIISLVGGNEQGKSSVIDALAVLGLHHRSRFQKDLIRYGTVGFGIQCELEDGTVVTRIKKEKDNVNYYSVEKNGEEIWSTTKIDGGLPPQVAEVMGFIQEPETKEYLHFRTYREKLLFIDTPASTNYKVMYTALKVENLTKAIKEGSEKANLIKGSIGRNEAEINTRTSQLRNIRVIDIEPAVLLKERLVDNLNKLDRLNRTVELVKRAREVKDNLGAMRELAGIKEISETKALRLGTINSLMERKVGVKEKRSIYSKIETIEELDYKLILEVGKVRNNINDSKNKRSLLGSLCNLSGIKEVNYVVASGILGLSGLVEKRKNLHINTEICDIKEINETSLCELRKLLDKKSSSGNLAIEIYKSNSELAELRRVIKESGALVTDCDNCGSSVVIDPKVIGEGVTA